MIWLHNSRKTQGLVWFMGHTLELNGSITSHLVVLIVIGKDSLDFKAEDNLGFKVGDTVPVRYQVADPSDARIDIPVYIWGDVWVDCLLPVLVLLILYITPDRFDPLIPRKASIFVGGKPFIKVLR